MNGNNTCIKSVTFSFHSYNKRIVFFSNSLVFIYLLTFCLNKIRKETRVFTWVIANMCICFYYLICKYFRIAHTFPQNDLRDYITLQQKKIPINTFQFIRNVQSVRCILKMIIKGRGVKRKKEIWFSKVKNFVLYFH